jgi:creatinine amidohydrolase
MALLHLSTWQEVEQRLRDSTGIIIPIGSTEQHGPNGLIGTDAICPEVVARGVGDKLDALVGPTVGIGNAQHHLGFPGSITLRPSTLLAVVRDIVQSLAYHGFDRIYFLNGHGGNIATVTAAFSEAYADITLRGGRSIQCRLRNWWDGGQVQGLSRRFYGDKEGSHGTCSEISLTQYAYPESIKRATFNGVAPKGSGIFDAVDFRERYPDGRIGSDPSLSSPEHGEKLFQAAVDDVAADYRAFVEK